MFVIRVALAAAFSVALIIGALGTLAVSLATLGLWIALIWILFPYILPADTMPATEESD
jgi:hypothetical protein